MKIAFHFSKTFNLLAGFTASLLPALKLMPLPHELQYGHTLSVRIVVAFIADWKRDRASLAKGYQTMRFSGTEICNDPACASQELAQYLHGVL